MMKAIIFHVLLAIFFLNFLFSHVLSNISKIESKVPRFFGRNGTLTPLLNQDWSYFELLKREDTWQKALRDGQEFVDKLNGVREQSPWSTVDELKANGWTIPDSNPDTMTDEYSGRRGPYQALEIQQSNGLQIGIKQNVNFDNCFAKDVKATDGSFDQVYNLLGKAIISLNTFSPVYYAGRDHPDLPRTKLAQFVPQIHKWSDVVAIQWAKLAEEQGRAASSLKYVFKHNVVTDFTKEVMDRVARVPVGIDAFEKPWPGIILARGSDRFRALLGTPHGKGVVWLLINHPNLFPNKDIEKITMFTDEYGSYELLFTLTD